jgi:predicted nucleic acid-binding protein
VARKADAYVDTSAFIAFADRSDSYQRRIRSCWSTDRHLGLSGVPLLIHEP